MADIEFDPIVNGISRGLGNFVYAIRDGKSYIRKRPRKAAWVTPQQTAHRSLFRTVAGSWTLLADVVKKSWEQFNSSSNTCEYTIYMSENLAHLKKDEPMNLTYGTGLTAPAESGASNAAGEVTLTYTASADAPYLTVYRQTEGENGQTDFAQVSADAAQSPVTITGLASEKDVTLYCIFSDKPMDQAKMISASQGLSVTVK